MINNFSLAAFRMFSLSLAFSAFTMMYLCVDYFTFFLYGIAWDSWMCRLIFISKFEKFSTIDSFDIFSILFSFFLLVLPLFYLGALKGVPHISEALFIFLHLIFFPAFWLIISIEQTLSFLILSSAIYNLCSCKKKLI